MYCLSIDGTKETGRFGRLINHSRLEPNAASKKVIMARSALPTSTKRSILVQEGLRRLRNTSPDLLWEHKVEHLNIFMLAMYKAGHQESFRVVVLKRVIAKYKATLDNHLKEDPCMYRSKKERKIQQMEDGVKSNKLH